MVHAYDKLLVSRNIVNGAVGCFQLKQPVLRLVVHVGNHAFRFALFIHDGESDEILQCQFFRLVRAGLAALEEHVVAKQHLCLFAAVDLFEFHDGGCVGSETD